MVSPPTDRISILGVSVDAITGEDVLLLVGTFVAEGAARQIITANPLMILAAEKDAALRAAFRSADLVVPDSSGVQWAALLQGRRLEKISGIDLMDRLCARAAERGWRVFLLGAAPGVADAAGKELLLRHPRLSIVGTCHGYFEPDAVSTPSTALRESAVLSLVAAARPDLLFVALSTPRQDGWIHQNLHRLGAKVVLGVGGSFDVISGRLRRAPAWMRAVGLEWLFRLIQEPRRAGRMLGLPLFVARVLRSGESSTRS
ncbi:MAG: WecB/TagA/CpsF family glycosyltransferase [Elusimicrobia bacterium]|nr:WecB/TagA/CpsF family glycosyltransferase [Elusimicrobiota bacterium]